MKRAADATPNMLLVEARCQRHWTQQVVAERVGTTVVNVSRWERGLSTPGAYFRYHLCALFGKSVEELGLALCNSEDRRQCLCQQAAQHEAPASALPPASHPLWHVPFLRNPLFTGREALLQRLHHALAPGQSVSTPCALSGLGGMGKTQTALEYAHRFRAAYSAVLWARAETRDTLLEDVVVLADTLGLLKPEKPEQARAVASVKHWLSEHADWLLILDNVDDLALTQEVLPTSHAGQVLLTTRTQITGTLAQRIELPPMEQEEGALFLLRRAKLVGYSAPLEEADRTVSTTARAISHLLDGLPLALDQAGAYIEETGCSVSDYLARYQQRCALLLDRRGGTQHDHPQSVRATLSLAFERVERLHPAAADLLRLCAFLYPDSIPLRAMEVAGTDLGPHLQECVADCYALDSMVATLRTASLLSRHAETQALTIHRVVQAVIQDTMDPDTRHLWAERAVCLISDACWNPQKLLHWFHWPHAFPHVMVSDSLLSAVALIEQWGMTSKEAARLLYISGIYFLERGQDAQAAVLVQRAQAMREHRGERPFPDAALVLEHYRQLLAAMQKTGDKS